MSEKVNILVVDDEKDIALSIINYLKKHIPDLNTLAAFDGEKALQILKSTKIDILITDIRMPGKNGIELLLELRKINPQARAIVITAYGSDIIKRQSEQAGALHYIEKPFKLSHLCTLVKKIIKEDEEGFKGNVSQLQLIDVLQMVCMNRKSMIVEVKNQNLNGKIFIVNGEIVDCQCGTKSGKTACYEILSWKNGEFNLLPLTRPEQIKKTINENWMTLFMEIMKEIDESSKTAQRQHTEGNPKIREIVISLFQKIDNIESNFIFDTEKRKIFFDGNFDDNNLLNPKIEDYSAIIKKFEDYVEKLEKENLSEIVIILKNSFLIFMKLSSTLVWYVKIKDVNKLGMAKITLERCKKLLLEELNATV